MPIDSIDLTAFDPVRDGLRALGRHLDDHGRRLIMLVQGDPGFTIVTSDLALEGDVEHAILSYDDLRLLTVGGQLTRGVRETPSSPDPFFVTGYEDFLRSLGGTMSDQGWRWVRLLRLGDTALLVYGDEGSHQRLTLRSADVEAVINDSFLRREEHGGSTDDRR